MIFVWIVLFLLAFGVLAYHRASLQVWTIGLGVLLLMLTFLSSFGIFYKIILWLIYLLIFIPLNMSSLRRHLFTAKILNFYRKAMPKLSDTESEALAAGTTGWPAELFSGMPNWEQMRAAPFARLSEEENEFLAGPVETLCGMLDGWKISRSMQIPDEVWKFLKTAGFFGLIIPKQFGGKEFSAAAHSQILVKIAGVSVAVATVVAVPNSLGPAELLLHYGTDEQKNYYLPRLANGAEIPCFALTSPVAGSDAGAITDHGIICRQTFEGKEQLCIRLYWDKRYITLAPVATLLGLAFKLYDPDHLLGGKEKLGITCALIPVQTAGVVIGRRHYPLDCAFPNGPTQGNGVIIPLDWVIGGSQMVGRGWRMLMECLAAGRSISLPSMATGGVKKAALLTGAYARFRQQFNVYIGQFGGVQEALTRIAAYTYTTEAVRLFTIAALDQNQRPAVASAISKYQTTEFSRMVVRDAMDVHGGKAVCMGPNNYLAQGYIEQPICITVEGANILTRSMIIFGQGAVRCHPYVLAELNAAMDTDAKKSLVNFDKALFAHIGFFISNAARSFLLGISNARLAGAPQGNLKRYYQQLTRFSAILAFMADFCMLVLGAALKREEKISGRLADILSGLYQGSAVLKYFESNNNPETSRDELPVIAWIFENLCYDMQKQLDELILNLPNVFLRGLARVITLPLGKYLKPPKDRLGASVAKLLMQPGVLRNHLADQVYTGIGMNNPLNHLEQTLQRVIAVEPLQKKIQEALRQNLLTGYSWSEWLDSAKQLNILSASEFEEFQSVYKEKMKMINVDDFAPEMLDRLAGGF